MLVHEVMTKDPVSVRPGATVKDALGLLSRHRVTSLPVVSGGRTVIGIVSEADLIRDLLASDPRAHEIPPEDRTDPPRVVDQVMSTHVVSTSPDADLAEAVELMTSTTVKSLPVLDRHGRLLGVLSRSDVVGLLATSDAQIEAQVDHLLRSSGLHDWLVEVTDGSVSLMGPEQSSDELVARLLARTVPGVLEVTLRTEEQR